MTLGNDSVLSIIHEARVRYLNNLSFTEMNAGGAGIIMIDSAIEYKSEGFYGDVLIVEVTAGDFDKLGCNLFYRISNKNNAKEIARAKTGILFYDYTNKKISRIPELFIEKVKANQPGI
jgi:acyl-CoA thioester hydrolase